jgi:hypothetical protein
MPDRDLEWDVTSLRVEWGTLHVTGPGRLRLTSDAVTVDVASGETLTAAYSEIRGGGWRTAELALHGAPGTMVFESNRGLQHAWASLLALACPLPELVRDHRLLGSRRGGHVGLQARFLAPLLQARKRLEEEGDLDARVATLDARALRERLATAVQGLAKDVYPASHPDRRALEAELEEALDSLFSGIDAIELAAKQFRDAPEAIRFTAWRRWVSAVSHVFALADRGWANAARLLPSTVKP